MIEFYSKNVPEVPQHSYNLGVRKNLNIFFGASKSRCEFSYEVVGRSDDVDIGFFHSIGSSLRWMEYIGNRSELPERFM
jgi:hypothetical protein